MAGAGRLLSLATAAIEPRRPLSRVTTTGIATGIAALALALAATPCSAGPASAEASVSRSDIFVGQPNILPQQAMPLGNGRLGVAIWAAGGLTLQLNRADTLPGRLSPGEVVFEGLAPMIADRKFRGRLDLFNGEWRQTGAGMSVHVVVDTQLDRVIVDVAGADPQVEQTVSLKLWEPRSPTALVGMSDRPGTSAPVGTLGRGGAVGAAARDGTLGHGNAAGPVSASRALDPADPVSARAAGGTLDRGGTVGASDPDGTLSHGNAAGPGGAANPVVGAPGRGGTPGPLGASDVALAEHWTDNAQPGASGLPFGSLAGVRVIARDVAGRQVDGRTVATTFHAMPDGHYRVIIASPSFNGRQDVTKLLRETLDPAVDLSAIHRWWNDFWARACLIQATSRDGRAEYFEALRTLFLFYSAAQNRGSLPGSQAGIGDLFSSARDKHSWDPASFWEWNLRMQVAANLSAGVPELNAPFFALYRNNLDAIRQWTRAKMGGRDGICVPETMRFNGVGVEYEAAGPRPFAVITHSCDQEWPAVANARTLSTGAEVGLWVWETYLKTGDMQSLRANYPLMAESARFLLAYQKPGADGLLHTSPSNAHETQSDVLDPTTDLAAIRALYPATIAAAHTLSRDNDLATALTAALAKTPPLPLMDAPSPASRVATTAPDQATAPGKIIAPSYSPTSPLLNAENIGLEPVWPYSLITPDSELFQTAMRTYEHRPFRDLATWSYDAIQAARLGLGDEVSRRLNALTQVYQIYPNGMSDLTGYSGEFYIEQMGIMAVALAEALVQDHGDVIRIGPAIPHDWTMKGTVYARGNARITVTAVEGKVTAFELAAGSTHTFRIANPWAAGEVLTVNAKAGRTSTYQAPTNASIAVTTSQPLTVKASARPGATSTAAQPGSGVTPAIDSHKTRANQLNTPSFPPGPPTRPKTLGRSAIGLSEPCCATPTTYNPATDRYPTPTPTPTPTPASMRQTPTMTHPTAPTPESH
jgi:alpha-L-fucosidase 2